MSMDTIEHLQEDMIIASTIINGYGYDRELGRRYKYIIVRGGTIGYPPEATLSQNFNILLKERGGSPYGNIDIENVDAVNNPLREIDNYTSIAQGYVSEDGVYLDRARVLGG
ncbi:hypothetical protein SUGI_0968550 [Cryptomeria japonica]|nr:hypothetical protein SUGI_0968550 [Cryptomeria japonica]